MVLEPARRSKSWKSKSPGTCSPVCVYDPSLDRLHTSHRARLMLWCSYWEKQEMVRCAGSLFCPLQYIHPCDCAVIERVPSAISWTIQRGTRRGDCMLCELVFSESQSDTIPALPNALNSRSLAQTWERNKVDLRLTCLELYAFASFQRPPDALDVCRCSSRERWGSENGEQHVNSSMVYLSQVKWCGTNNQMQ